MKVHDYLRMLRIGDWIKFYMAVPLAGALLAGANASQLIQVFIIFFSLISYAFTVNNYFDVEIDRLHNGKIRSNRNPLASGLISANGVIIIMLIQIGISLISIAMSSLGFGLVVLNIILFTVYSGIIRLKERPVLDIINHGLMFGAVPFLAGFALCAGSIPLNVLFLAAPLFILGAEALIAHQIMEYEEDMKSTRTTITMIGQRNGLLLLGLLVIISIGALFFVNSMRQQLPLPIWAVAGFGWYLLAYPAYSCRRVLYDIRYSASA
jgi:4-hydroxybenzoate polyprenyltransferase